MPDFHNENIKDTRVVAFAASELMLDIFFRASTTANRDLESIWIMICVMHNTLSDVVTNPVTTALHINDADLPANVRPSMSRRAIADQTGLVRENVRRRTNRLVQDGLLEKAAYGKVRLSREIEQNSNQSDLNVVHSAIAAYFKRLAQHDVTMPLEIRE